LITRRKKKQKEGEKKERREGLRRSRQAAVALWGEKAGGEKKLPRLGSEDENFWGFWTQCPEGEDGGRERVEVEQ